MSIFLETGEELKYSGPLSVEELGSQQTPKVKNIVAGYINGQLVDASEIIPDGSTVSFSFVDSIDGLDTVRHTAAHLLAHALYELWPDVKLAIGPTIADGFYYDIEMEHRLSPEDLPTIERRMQQLVKRNYKVEREIVTKQQAIEHFQAQNQPYKVELAQNIPEGEVIALYRHQQYTDMCRGPHVTRTGLINHFKLTHLAGAYWRGDSNNPMLQRIYGTLWESAEALSLWQKRQAEAAQRDHRKLGTEMDLFHLQEEAPGCVFWHPAGWQLYRKMEEFIREYVDSHGYEEIKTPQIIDQSLWQKSGHADKFADNMYLTGDEEKQFALKPMNCPGHIQVYSHRGRSYRELPIRYAEFGSCHRKEPSGTLHGILRVRAFTQDDGHIFCTPEQIADEVSDFIDQTLEVYSILGFDSVDIALSTRPEKRVGDDALWDLAETRLEQVLQDKNLAYVVNQGEGAFYGPKIEFQLTDAIGRKWQCGTAQLDFAVPGRLAASYTDANDSKVVPVMIHRAILGTLERFIGVMIEECEGFLPLWLAPRQVRVLAVSEKHTEYAEKVSKMLGQNGIAVDADISNNKLGYKIRQARNLRIPFLLIVGDQELQDKTVAVRRRADDFGSENIEVFLENIRSEIDKRAPRPIVYCDEYCDGNLEENKS